MIVPPMPADGELARRTRKEAATGKWGLRGSGLRRRARTDRTPQPRRNRSRPWGFFARAKMNCPAAVLDCLIYWRPVIRPTPSLSAARYDGRRAARRDERRDGPRWLCFLHTRSRAARRETASLDSSTMDGFSSAFAPTCPFFTTGPRIFPVLRGPRGATDSFSRRPHSFCCSPLVSVGLRGAAGATGASGLGHERRERDCRSPPDSFGVRGLDCFARRRCEGGTTEQAFRAHGFPLEAYNSEFYLGGAHFLGFDFARRPSPPAARFCGEERSLRTRVPLRREERRAPPGKGGIAVHRRSALDCVESGLVALERGSRALDGNRHVGPMIVFSFQMGGPTDIFRAAGWILLVSHSRKACPRSGGRRGQGALVGQRGLFFGGHAAPRRRRRSRTWRSSGCADVIYNAGNPATTCAHPHCARRCPRLSWPTRAHRPPDRSDAGPEGAAKNPFHMREVIRALPERIPAR